MPHTKEAYKTALRLTEAVLASSPEVIFDYKPVNYRDHDGNYQVRAAQIAEFIATLAQELEKSEKQFRVEE